MSAETNVIQCFSLFQIDDYLATAKRLKKKTKGGQKKQATT
jgi:hypothetical protein